jgi:hypothetical protein
MRLFRADPESGLRKAEAALTAAEARLAELASDRAVALRESDDVGAVQVVDARITETLAAVNVHRDRITALKAAVREQRTEETDRQRAIAIAEIERRLADQVKLAATVETAVRDLGRVWNELLNWRGAIIAGWPDALPLPPPDAFHDVRELRRELATALYSAGKPAWDRECSIPAPASPIGVEGLSPKGIAGFVTMAGNSFLARLKMHRVDVPEGEQAA